MEAVQGLHRSARSVHEEQSPRNVLECFAWRQEGCQFAEVWALEEVADVEEQFGLSSPR